MPQAPTPEEYAYLRRLAHMSGPSTGLAVHLALHGAGSATRDQRTEILTTVSKVFTVLKAQGWVRATRATMDGHAVTYYAITGKGLTLVAETEEARRKQRKRRR